MPAGRPLAILLVCTIASTGCAPMTQSEIKALETREIDLPYDDAYRAAANGLFSLGFTVEHSDKVSGILTGHRKDPQTGAKIAAGILFGVLGVLATGDRNEAVTFMLAALDTKTTQLRMKVVINGQAIVDRQFMTQIWQQIEREAMLESRPSDRTPTSQPSSQPVELTPNPPTG